MNELILADRDRATQFALIGAERRVLRGWEAFTDAEGVAWACRRVGGHAFGFTWLPGWAFDPYAASRKGGQLAEMRRATADADDDQHAAKLASVYRSIITGPLTERLLWSLHRGLLAARKSVLRVPDFVLAGDVWGGQKPAHWRTDLLRLLGGLTWLHLARREGEGPPAFGPDTALLTHVADLRGKDADACGEDCPGRLGPRHHHYLINVGRGFLGVLEQFGHEQEDAPGVRAYEFPQGGRKSTGPCLWRVGKEGSLASAYLPAKLGDPPRCDAFTASQHRLLQALVREVTRPRKHRRGAANQAGTLPANAVPSFGGKRTITCPLLDPVAAHAAFNGNGLRRGEGYLLTTPGGWLHKAGYRLTDVAVFLDDLAVLAGPLGLLVVAVGPGAKFTTLTDMRGLALTAAGRQTLSRLHVRVYSVADYLERWRAVFDPPTPEGAASDADAHGVAKLLVAMKDGRVSQRALAEGIDEDPSFVNKILTLKKACPVAVLQKAEEWLAAWPHRGSRS